MCNKKFGDLEQWAQHFKVKHKAEASSHASRNPAPRQKLQIPELSYQPKSKGKKKSVKATKNATKKTLSRSVSWDSIPDVKRLAAAPKPATHPHTPDLTSIIRSASDKNLPTTAGKRRREATNSVDSATVRAYFDEVQTSTGTTDSGVTLADWKSAGSFPEAMLLGHQRMADGELLSNAFICVSHSLFSLVYRSTLPHLSMIFLLPLVINHFLRPSLVVRTRHSVVIATDA